MRRPLASLLLLLGLIPLSALAIEPGTHEMLYESYLDGSEQPYHLYVPRQHDRGEALPLVVTLHGRGGSWRSWFQYTPIRAWAEREGWVVAAPHGRGDWFYQGPGETDVLEVIDDVKARCAIDENRIYLMGHSMGGWGTFQLGISHPDVFAAIVPMAGWAPLELVSNLEHVPTMIVHGDDDVVVPVERSRAAFAAMDGLPGEVVYLEMPGQGHGSNMIGATLPLVAEWLRGRQRPATVTHVSSHTLTPSRGQNRWLDIVSTTDFPNHAWAEGTIEGGRLLLETHSVDALTLELAHPDLRTAGVRAVEIDGQTVRVGANDDVLFLRRRRSGAWALASGESPPSPVLAQVPERIEDSLPILCTILAEATGADTGIMRGVYACPSIEAGDLTADEALDLYLRPMDELHVAELPSSVIAEITRTGRNRMAPPLDLSDPDRVYTVALTLYQVRRLPEGTATESTGRIIGDVIVDHVASQGSLPAP